ncbi:uncharacterized protein LOC143285372 [Babylonia areolata]|uniref:uncharacterized protein LOC143285372 n=1 Tax=Babylonia areolata TaxID=304850 RepID=UPI003FD431F6
MTISSHLRSKRRRQDSDCIPNGQMVDNAECIIGKMFDMFSQAEMSDVQLKVGVHLFHAHKLILSMNSDVFRTMLTDDKWPDARKPCIVLSEEPECEEVFGDFLQYLYTGRVQLTNTCVLAVLTLADKYNIYELGRECKNYMATHCHASLPILKVVSWLQYAILCNDKGLEGELRHYMELNFRHVIKSEDFLTMRQDTLEELLSCQHLVVHSEFTLFNSLKDWFLFNIGCSQLFEQESAVDGKEECGDASLDEHRKTRQAMEKDVFMQLMSYIRLPIMKHAQLLALASDPLVQLFPDFALKVEGALNVYTDPLTHGVCGTADDMAASNSSPSCSRSLCRRKSDSMIVQSKDDLSGLSACSAALNAGCASGSADRAMSVPFSVQASRSRATDIVSGHMSDIPAASLVRHSVPSPSLEYSAHCTPRNYLCDDWSTCLTIENFASFPSYSSQAYFFSTPASAVQSPTLVAADRLGGHDDTEDGVLEWQAELYPRGIRFPRARMIGIPYSYDIEESCRDVVRLAINSKTHHEKQCRVDVIVLAVAYGLADQTEYMETLTHRTCIFDNEHTVHNIDDIVPFWELNDGWSRYQTDSVLFPGKKSSCFKLVLIIKPSDGVTHYSMLY